MAAQTRLSEEFKNQNLHINEVLRQLNTNVEDIATHSKMLETQISQVNQQQASASLPQVSLSGQPEQNPRGHLNALTTLSNE